MIKENKISGPDTTDECGEGGFLFSQFKLYIDVYTRHLDIFLKGVLLFLALIGGVAGFIYRENASSETQVALSVVACLLSLIMLTVCLKSMRFLIDLKKIVDEIADQLDIRRFPFSGVRGAIRGITVGAAVFCVASAVNLYLVLNCALTADEIAQHYQNGLDGQGYPTGPPDSNDDGFPDDDQTTDHRPVRAEITIE